MQRSYLQEDDLGNVTYSLGAHGTTYSMEQLMGDFFTFEPEGEMYPGQLPSSDFFQPEIHALTNADLPSTLTAEERMNEGGSSYDGGMLPEAYQPLDPGSVPGTRKPDQAFRNNMATLPQAPPRRYKPILPRPISQNRPIGSIQSVYSQSAPGLGKKRGNDDVPDNGHSNQYLPIQSRPSKRTRGPSPFVDDSTGNDVLLIKDVPSAYAPEFSSALPSGIQQMSAPDTGLKTKYIDERIGLLCWTVSTQNGKNFEIRWKNWAEGKDSACQISVDENVNQIELMSPHLPKWTDSAFWPTGSFWSTPAALNFARGRLGKWIAILREQFGYGCKDYSAQEHEVTQASDGDSGTRVYKVLRQNIHVRST